METRNLSWEQAVEWLRNQPEKHDLVNACYFDDPLIEAAERFYQSLEWVELRKLFPNKKGRALDLGAGRGIASYALAKDNWQVSAVEPDPSDLVGAGAIRSLASESGLNIEIISHYSESLPFPDDFFDLVNCRQALHHAADLGKTCDEIFRVLKKGGTLVASREHVISKKEDLELFLNTHPLHFLYGGENAFLLKEYLDKIYQAGFELCKIYATFDSPINYFPMTEDQWILICTRKIGDRFGDDFVLKIFNSSHRLGRLFIRILASLVNWRNNAPGRLYTFVVTK